MAKTPAVKRVAIIGTGPAGAIAIDAFAQEQAFNVIRVFERREQAGGCWLFDEDHSRFTDIDRYSQRQSVDLPVEVPERLPAQTSKHTQYRYAETSVYPYLESNVDAEAMEFSQEPVPVERSQRSIALHGSDTPYRPYQVYQKYVQGLVNRKGYQDLVEYNTTVEHASKKNGEWELILRRSGEATDYWWKETFDALVVASGHYTVPYIPLVSGLQEFEEQYPGSVIHTKAFRGREKYRGKKVIVVGASVSGADTAVDLLGVAQSPVYAVVKGHKPNLYFGDHAFKHPDIQEVASIKHIDATTRTAVFADGQTITNVDAIIFATGYTWTLPFLPHIPIRNNRVPDLYLHVFHQSDPSLAFVGAIGAGLTFKAFEWQAVIAARVISGRATLPPLEEQQKWERDRISVKGDGVPFTVIWPKFEEYFETIRKLAGEPSSTQPGRRLPPFDPKWVRAFVEGHQRRIKMWKRANTEAEERLNDAALILAKL